METKTTTLEAQWLEYRDACYPAKNGKLEAQQEIETRQSFYAGCLIAIKVMIESSVGMTEEAAMQNINNLRNEAEKTCRQRIYEMKARN
jgi:hypothetical protein